VVLYLAFATPKGRVAPGIGNNVNLNGYSFIAYTVNRDGAYERVSDRTAWSSNDEGILRSAGNVSSAGIKSFLAVSPGTPSVTARFQGLEATAPLLIVDSSLLSLPRLELTWTSQSVATVGALVGVLANFRPATGSVQEVTRAATWSSSNPEVATVDGGAIRTLAIGSTIITANFDGFVEWFWVSVMPRS
jgi:hypothetical protein